MSNDVLVRQAVFEFLEKKENTQLKRVAWMTDDQFWEVNANANRAKCGQFLRDVFKLRMQNCSFTDDTHHGSVQPQGACERGTRH